MQSETHTNEVKIIKTRFICLILAFVLAIFCLASCQEKHTHAFYDSYSADETHHWYACSCGEVSEKAEHSFDDGKILIYPTTEAEGVKSLTCLVCGYKKNEKIEKLESDHSHVYDLWGSDADQHWRECVCGDVSGRESHSFDGGKPGADGLTEYTCECGYKRVSSGDGITATTVLCTLDGQTLRVISTEADEKGIFVIELPEIEGYLPEYDKIIITEEHNSLTNRVYYSPVSIWDGVSVSESLTGSGTEADPFLIQNAADFVYLGEGNFDGKYIKMTVSVDLDENAFSITEFGGILDGNHCSVRGINVNSSANNAGLIGKIKSDASVSDLSLYGNVVGAEIVGALAAESYGTLDGVVSYVTVSAKGKAGGILGISNGSVQNCISYGSISGGGRNGGIAYSAKGSIEGCVNHATVEGSWDIGGIVAYIADNASISLENCLNYGSVKGTTGIGGILGYTELTSTVSVKACTNYGNITATWGGGGIAGNTHGTVTDCVNNGTVSGDGELGGLVGKCYGKITGCTNNGTVSGSNDIIGGLVGNLHIATHGETICTENTQNGTVLGPNAEDLIGKGYYKDDYVEPGPLTEEEFLEQPAMYGSPWTSGNTRMKILVKIKMTKGTVITFLGDTSVYCFGVMETTDKENASAGAWKDSGWNTSWADPTAKTYTTTYASGYLVLTVGKLDASGKPTLTLTEDELKNIHSMFKIEGNKAGTDGSGSINNPWLDEDMVSINHRGWHEAPENTLSAYEESYNHGFKYVECDVQFTKDGVPVLLHDDTIDRTSDGSGAVNQFTYAELLQFDFSYDDADTVNDFSAYRGERIPTFEEFIALCKRLGLHPYIEIKGSITADEAKLLVKIVSDADMLKGVSWLSFSGDALARIADNCPGARLVWVLTNTNATKIAANNIPFAEANLMTGESEVVFDLYYTLVNQDVVDLLREYSIPLEVWTVNNIEDIYGLHPYVSGVSSDMYNAKDVLSTKQ